MLHCINFEFCTCFDLKLDVIFFNKKLEISLGHWFKIQDCEVYVSAEAAFQFVLFRINNSHCVYSKQAPKMQAKGDISPQYKLPQPLFTTRGGHYNFLVYTQHCHFFLEESNTSDFSNEWLNTTPITMLATKWNSTYYHVMMSITILDTLIETATILPVTKTTAITKPETRSHGTVGILLKCRDYRKHNCKIANGSSKQFTRRHSPDRHTPR